MAVGVRPLRARVLDRGCAAPRGGGHSGDAARFARSGASRWRRCALIRQAGFTITGVVVDADYGSNAQFRAGLERLGLPYGVAIRGEVSCAVVGVAGTQSASAIAQSAPEDAWESVTWGTGTAGPLTARFCALRVRPTKGRGDRWLLCERSATDERKYYLLHLPDTTALVDLVALARSRWPIEQQYRELKDDLGLDHFEGRTYHGWAHHVVLTAVAFTFLQIERGRDHRRAQTHAARRPRLGARDHGPALRHPQSAAPLDARQLPPKRAASKVTK